MRPLRDDRLAFVRKELDEIGVAVRVTGSGHVMMKRLHGYGEELLDSLHGSRPEVRKLSGDLTRGLHNLQKTNPRDSVKAHKAIWSIRDMADRLIKLRQKFNGLRDVDPELKLGRLRLDNVYGYTAKELKAATGRIRRTVEMMGEMGLFKKLVYGDIVLDPEDSSGKFATYLTGLDAIAVNPEKWSSDSSSLIEAFGDRLWLQYMGKDQREVWGGGTGWARFTRAFVGVLDERSVSADTSARLSVTMQKVADSRR